MTYGYKEQNKVFKFNRSLLGLKQSARNFYAHLKVKLIKQCFKQSKLNACLFLHQDMLVLVYVDNCIFFNPKRESITEMMDELKQDELKMDQEHDMAG